MWRLFFKPNIIKQSEKFIDKKTCNRWNSNSIKERAYNPFFDKKESLIYKDVLLFVNKPKMTYLILAVAYGQLIYMFNASYSMYVANPVPQKGVKEFKNAPVSNKMTRFGEYFLRKKRYFTFVPAIFGILFLCPPIYITKRFIRSITLKTGGKEVTFETLNLFGRKDFNTYPLNEVTALTNRQICPGSFISLKKKKVPFNYAVDKEGKFLEPRLYDEYLGVSRLM